MKKKYQDIYFDTDTKNLKYSAAKMLDAKVGIRCRKTKPYAKVVTPRLGTEVETFVKLYFPDAYITSGRYSTNFLKKDRNTFTLALWE